MTDRYRSKADELGVGVMTVRRWVRAFQRKGDAGLIGARRRRASDPLRGVDPRCLDGLRVVLDEHAGASRPTQALLLDRVDARTAEQHGPEVVPKRCKAKLAVGQPARDERSDGRDKGQAQHREPPRRSVWAADGHTTGRVSAAGHDQARRVRDGRRHDAAVALDLTIAVDLFSRSVVTLRHSPVSTKALDASLVLFEAICPDSRRPQPGGLLPYAGVPSAVQIASGDRPACGLPGVAPEMLVLDNGKIYVSAHLRSVCQRLGISIQPARPCQPTDKALVGRIFRTIGEDLLAALPGFKGPDVYSRGEHPEQEAYCFVDELEQLIHEWLAERYHRRPHHGLMLAEVPGLELSPNDAFEIGVARAGRMLLPARADVVYDFLPLGWCTIQHSGVEVHGLRYDNAALNGHRNRRSDVTGPNGGKWPIQFDRGLLSGSRSPRTGESSNVKNRLETVLPGKDRFSIEMPKALRSSTWKPQGNDGWRSASGGHLAAGKAGPDHRILAADRSMRGFLVVAFAVDRVLELAHSAAERDRVRAVARRRIRTATRLAARPCVLG